MFAVGDKIKKIGDDLYAFVSDIVMIMVLWVCLVVCLCVCVCACFKFNMFYLL